MTPKAVETTQCTNIEVAIFVACFIFYESFRRFLRSTARTHCDVVHGLTTFYISLTSNADAVSMMPFVNDKNAPPTTLVNAPITALTTVLTTVLTAVLTTKRNGPEK